MVALAGAIVLGPRLGRKFKRDGGGPMMPHDLTIAASGGLLLWFGWYGFNPGSTLSAMDFEGIGRISANTTLAACAAGLTAMFAAYILNKKWDVSFTVNGFLAGLVAITCPCYWVSPTGSIILGGIAGVIVILGVELLEWLRIDDPIGAVPVHGICGIWGTLSLGLFAVGKYGATGPTGPDNSAALTGLFYGGGLYLFKAHPSAVPLSRLSTPSECHRCSCTQSTPWARSASPERANCTVSISTSTASPPTPSTSSQLSARRPGCRWTNNRLRRWQALMSLMPSPRDVLCPKR